MDNVKVEVRGIKELNKAFRQVDSELPKELRAAFLVIAQRVVGTAQQRMPHKTGRAQLSVKPRASQRGAAIAFGGSKAPYMPWLDFGGSVGRGHVPGQAWSGSIKRDWRGVPTGSGRFVYPAISQEREATAEAALDAVEGAAEKAGFEVNG